MAELIIALDFGHPGAALAMAERMRGRVSWLKVGLELFCAAGPALVKTLRSKDFNIFLDLKIYDIPNTAAGAVREAAKMGAAMLTVHCQGGRRMCESALEAAMSLPEPPLIVGVTALTSFAEDEMPGINVPPHAYALELAGLAEAWGLNGVVCSGHEAGEIKSLTGLLAVCPGIRPAISAHGDQRRVVTPSQAVAAGADFLVVGRPVTASPAPEAAVEQIMAEMAPG